MPVGKLYGYASVSDKVQRLTQNLIRNTRRMLLNIYQPIDFYRLTQLVFWDYAVSLFLKRTGVMKQLLAMIALLCLLPSYIFADTTAQPTHGPNTKTQMLTNRDGTYSCNQHRRGTCSHHGVVAT